MRAKVGSLDGRTVQVGTEVWQVHLFGTRLVGSERLVRVALLGFPSYTLMLKMPIVASALDAIDALESWLARSDRETGAVLDVKSGLRVQT